MATCEHRGVHRPGGCARNSLDPKPILLQQAVEHAPCEGSVRAPTLQRKIYDDGIAGRRLVAHHGDDVTGRPNDKPRDGSVENSLRAHSLKLKRIVQRASMRSIPVNGRQASVSNSASREPPSNTSSELGLWFLGRDRPSALREDALMVGASRSA